MCENMWKRTAGNGPEVYRCKCSDPVLRTAKSNRCNSFTLTDFKTCYVGLCRKQRWFHEVPWLMTFHLVIFRDFLCEHVIQLQDIDVYRPIALSWWHVSVTPNCVSLIPWGAEIDGALRGQVRDSQGGSWFVVMFLWHGCHMLPYYL